MTVGIPIKSKRIVDFRIKVTHPTISGEHVVHLLSVIIIIVAVNYVRV